MVYLQNKREILPNEGDTKILVPDTKCIYHCGRTLNSEPFYAMRTVQTNAMAAPAFYLSCVHCGKA